MKKLNNLQSTIYYMIIIVKYIMEYPLTRKLKTKFRYDYNPLIVFDY